MSDGQSSSGQRNISISQLSVYNLFSAADNDGNDSDSSQELDTSDKDKKRDRKPGVTDAQTKEQNAKIMLTMLQSKILLGDLFGFGLKGGTEVQLKADTVNDLMVHLSKHKDDDIKNCWPNL